MSPIMGLLPGRPAESLLPRLPRDRHDPTGRTSRIHRNPRTTWPGAPWRRLEPCCQEQPPDRARRDTHAQLQELARDPWVAPTWILPCQAQHELTYTTLNRRTPRPL